MSLYKYLIIEAVSEKKKQRIKEILDDYFVTKIVKSSDMYKRFEQENNEEAQQKMIDAYLEKFSSEDFVNGMIEIDPSGKGTYINWITRHYLLPIIKEKGFIGFSTAIREKFHQDLYKVKEYLELFHENKADLKRRDQHTDINQYKSPQELFQVIRPYRSGKKQEEPAELSDLVDNRYYIEHGEADLIVENEVYLVVVPKTKEASKFYACNTEWCTAYPREFESYNEDGTLFIFIYKKYIEKYDSDNMPDDILVQIYVPYTGEDIEARDSTDDWYGEWVSDMRQFEKEIVEYLRNLPEHEYDLYDLSEDKIPMDGGTYNLEKINNKWHVTFDDWSDMYHYVTGEEEFAKKLLEGGGFEYFESGYNPDLRDVIFLVELEEPGIKVLREKINKVIEEVDYPNKDELQKEVENIDNLTDYENFLESVDEDDFEDITNALGNSLQEAQDNVNEGEAYHLVTNFILEKIGGDPDKPNHQGGKMAFEYEYKVDDKNSLESVINLQSEQDPDEHDNYEHPYRGYEGIVTDELFTEVFIDRIDIDFN